MRLRIRAHLSLQEQEEGEQECPMGHRERRHRGLQECWTKHKGEVISREKFFSFSSGGKEGLPYSQFYSVIPL